MPSDRLELSWTGLQNRASPAMFRRHDWCSVSESNTRLIRTKDADYHYPKRAYLVGARRGSNPRYDIHSVGCFRYTTSTIEFLGVTYGNQTRYKHVHSVLPRHLGYVTPKNTTLVLKRGIEPRSQPYQGRVLPMYYKSIEYWRSVRDSNPWVSS